MGDIKRPIIGFTGFISYWRIDVETLTYIARKLPHCSIVMIGPVDELFDLEDVQDFRNIYFLGYKPPSQLPAYLKHFDVCINPQVRNEITRGNYPRKIDEYLAMGKPVVATDTEGMKLFKPYCWLCKNKFEFVENITLILSLPEDASSRAEIEKRKAFALTHTWESSMGRLGDAYHYLKSNLKNTGIQEPIIHKTNWLQVTSLSCLIAYLLFIFIKFLFF